MTLYQVDFWILNNRGFLYQSLTFFENFEKLKILDETTMDYGFMFLFTNLALSGTVKELRQMIK